MKKKRHSEKWNNRKYSQGLKGAVVCLQALCVAVIAVCVMILSYWTNGTFRLSELGKEFEESTTFLNDVENIVRTRINHTRDEALFQTDGEEDLGKKIDIRQ